MHCIVTTYAQPSDCVVLIASLNDGLQRYYGFVKKQSMFHHLWKSERNGLRSNIMNSVILYLKVRKILNWIDIALNWIIFFCYVNWFVVRQVTGADVTEFWRSLKKPLQNKKIFSGKFLLPSVKQILIAFQCIMQYLIFNTLLNIFFVKHSTVWFCN